MAHTVKKLLVISFLALASGAYTEAEKDFIKQEFGVDVDVETEKLANDESQNEQIRNEIEKELSDERGDYFAAAERADRAARAWVFLAVWLLEQKGYYEDAQKLQDDYLWKFSRWNADHYVFGFDPGSLEDHDPWSLWLELAYQILLKAVGERVLKLLHMDDIHELNYSIPVSLQPAGDDRTEPIRYWERPYYVDITSKYFAGPIAYWSVYWTCVGFTYGTGVVFACSPIGVLSERIVSSRIAPPIAGRIWDRNNH